MDLFKVPGVAETIDWAQALVELDALALDPETINDTLGVLLKYQDDIDQDVAANRMVDAHRCGGASDELRSETGARPAGWRLGENIMHFARVLRRGGLPIGPGRVIAALEAVEAVGCSHRDDVHAALSAVMLDRHEQREIFDQAFDVFWRDPDSSSGR